jgi:predicted dehydrogenase
VKRLQDGAIGEIHTGRAYWNGGVIWAVPRQDGWSDMEWQVRNWNYFTWLSGDHIVEQHVHNLDVINWVMGTHPIRAHALGGRQARPDDLTFGHVYDHFAVEYEYENGARMFSQCRQIDGTMSRVEEAVEGSNGSSNCYSWIRPRTGAPWRYEGEKPNPYEQEHQDLINSIREGTPINDARDVAWSTLTGIMGRESAYSGQPITWDQALNMGSLGPATYAFGPAEFPEVAVPGVYRGV